MKSKKIFRLWKALFLRFEETSLDIFINTISDLYLINGYDLYLNQKFNLYQYYFENNFILSLPNINHMYSIDNLKTTTFFNYGLHNPLTNKRGKLYINHELILNINNTSNSSCKSNP